MVLKIYTYGNIDAMYYTLNGIAMIMNSGFAGLMIKATSLIATFYYGLKAAYASSSGGAKQQLIKVAAMIIIINALLLPKTDITIEDRVTKQRDKVDNLPLGFAVPVGFMEAIGNIMTQAFEQGFSTVGNSSFSEYGMTFGARLLQESRNWKIKTPEFAYNMDHFIRRCAIIDASIGSKYTLNDLLTSDDMWQLVKSNAGHLRRVEVKVGSSHELKTCFEAAQILDNTFKSELDKLINKYRLTDFALAGTLGDAFTPRGKISAKNNFKNNFETVFGRYLDSDNSAETNLRQVMLINSMSDYSKNYGYARASATQESNWRIAGDVASIYLPILLSVMKGLVYASFIFMVPLMLIGGGSTKYMGYLALVASLQLWPALNSILNLFIDLYSSNSISGLAEGAISYTTYSKVGKYSDKIVAVASGLQMVIPYLSFSIVQGGVNGFINLASNITGASSSASAQAAQEVVTNNKSFDNYSASNMQYAMQQGFKTDWNSSYRAGASETQLNDGSIERVLPNGESIMQSGVGYTMSSSSVKFENRQGVSSQLAKNLSNAQSMLESESASYHEAEQKTFGKTASFVAAMAERQSETGSYQISDTSEEGKALQKVLNNTHALRQQYGYGFEQSANLALSGKMDIPAGKILGVVAGQGFKKVGAEGLANAITGISAATPDSLGSSTFMPTLSASISGGVDFKNNSSQSFGDENSLNKETVNREDYNAIIRAAKNEDFSKSHNLDKSYSDDVRSSHENQLRSEKSMNTQKEVVKNLSETLSTVQSQESFFSQDMMDKLEKEVAAQYGITRREAHNRIEHSHPSVNTVKDRMLAKSAFYERNGIMSAKQFDQDSNKQFNSNYEKYSQKVEEYHPHQKVENIAKEQGIDPQDQNYVNNTVEQKFESMNSNNNNLYEQAKQDTHEQINQRQEQINKYEEDRIGNGWASKVFTAGIGVGGPKNLSTVKAKENTNAAAVQVPSNKK